MHRAITLLGQYKKIAPDKSSVLCLFSQMVKLPGKSIGVDKLNGGSEIQ